MDTVLFCCFAAAYLVLLVWGVSLARRHGWPTPANLPLLVLAGLVYDNVVIATGRWIGDGALLHGLNLARFWIHAFVTPVLVAWGLHALRRSGVRWAQASWFQVLAIGSAVALMVLEYLTEVRGLQIAPKREYGVLSYSNTAPADGPPVMVLVVAAVLIAVGIALWRRQRWPWLLVGALVMTIGSAVQLPVASGAITNAFELLLLSSVVATKAFQDRRADQRQAR